VSVGVCQKGERNESMMRFASEAAKAGFCNTYTRQRHESLQEKALDPNLYLARRWWRFQLAIQPFGQHDESSQCTS